MRLLGRASGLVAAATLAGCGLFVSTAAPSAAGVHGCQAAIEAYQAHQSSLWLSLTARVSQLLPDESGGLVHQRFVVVCPGGQTVLIVNDVSIGTRVPVRLGDKVTVRGQYIWNSQGGLVHFTHHDPEGGQGGWIIWSGKVYSLEPASVALT